MRADAPEQALPRPRRIERLVRRMEPALAQHVAQRARCRTFDRHHQVVERRIRRAGRDAV
jgi:hypothetical protein